MSQITLRNLPDPIEREIRQNARDLKISLNRAILELLQKALGMEEGKTKKRDLSPFVGTWSSAQVEEFARNTKAFSKIDPEIWSE